MDVARYIRASGKPTGQTDARRRQICEVLCQGCGERISSADAEGVELSLIHIYLCKPREDP